LIRDRAVEASIHQNLGSFFASAPARRSLFVLKQRRNSRRSEEVAAQVAAALRSVG